MGQGRQGQNLSDRGIKENVEIFVLQETLEMWVFSSKEIGFC